MLPSKIRSSHACLTPITPARGNALSARPTLYPTLELHTEAKKEWFWGGPYRGHVGRQKGARLQPQVLTGFVGRGSSSLLGRASSTIA